MGSKNSAAGSNAGGGLFSPFAYVAYALIEIQNGSRKLVLVSSERGPSGRTLKICRQRRRRELVAPKCVRGQIVGWG